MNRSDIETQLARTYRMLFQYETDPEAEHLPALLTTMGQMDCLWEIRHLESLLNSEV